MSLKDQETSNGMRAGMFARIRSGLGVTAHDAVRQAAVAIRLKASKPHLIPDRVAKPGTDLRALLRSFLEGQSATVVDVATPADVPSAVTSFLRASNLPLRARMAQDAFLAKLDWATEPTFEWAGQAAGRGRTQSRHHCGCRNGNTGPCIRGGQSGHSQLPA
jgi:hypothetical protein